MHPLALFALCMAFAGVSVFFLYLGIEIGKDQQRRGIK